MARSCQHCLRDITFVDGFWITNADQVSTWMDNTSDCPERPVLGERGLYLQHEPRSVGSISGYMSGGGT